MSIIEKSRDLSLRAEVEDFYYAFAAVCDEGDLTGVLECFSEQGEYLMTTHGNHRGGGLMLVVDRTREAIKERLAYLGGYWNLQRSKTTHAVSNVRVVGVTDETVEVRAVLAMFKTDRLGQARFHIAGQYRDTLVRTPDGLRFGTHLVVVDGETLPSDLTDLL